MEEQTYYVVRLNGKLGTGYAGVTLADALSKANPEPTDYIAWGIVKAKSESVARMLDPNRWFTASSNPSARFYELEKLFLSK